MPCGVDWRRYSQKPSRLLQGLITGIFCGGALSSLRQTRKTTPAQALCPLGDAKPPFSREHHTWYLECGLHLVVLQQSFSQPFGLYITTESVAIIRLAVNLEYSTVITSSLWIIRISFKVLALSRTQSFISAESFNALVLEWFKYILFGKWIMEAITWFDTSSSDSYRDKFKFQTWKAFSCWKFPYSLSQR